MTRAEAKRYAGSTDPRVAAEAARVLAAAKARKARGKVLGKCGRAPGPTKAQRDAAADALEAAGKAAARARSGGRCEVYENGARCDAPSTDGHHVIGGRWKKDMEALPNGEGFQDCCRTHHELVGHATLREPSLLQAKEHAIRIGSRRLLRHVEAALARYRAKHPKHREGT